MLRLSNLEIIDIQGNPQLNEQAKTILDKFKQRTKKILIEK